MNKLQAGTFLNGITVSGSAVISGSVSVLTGTLTVATRALVGQSFGAVIGSALVGTNPGASFGANYYNDGTLRVRPDVAKEGLMFEMDATDSVYLQHITAAGVATIPLRITKAGAMSVLTNVKIGTTDTATYALELAENAYIAWKDSGTAGATNTAIRGSAGDIEFYAAANRLYIKSTGQILVGTTVTTGAAAGDFIVGNGRTIWGVNNAGTGLVQMIAIAGGSDNALYIGHGGAIIRLGTAASITGANAGELVNANNNYIRWSNGASTAALPVYGMNSSNEATIDLNGGYMGFLNPITLATAATAGGASALPGNPEKYFRIKIGGVGYRIALYNE